MQQEEEKRRKEEEIARRKEERTRELNARVNIGLAKPLEVRVNRLVTHRGGGAFTESQFDIITELRKKEKEMATKLVSCQVFFFKFSC